MMIRFRNPLHLLLGCLISLLPLGCSLPDVASPWLGKTLPPAWEVPAGVAAPNPTVNAQQGTVPSAPEKHIPLVFSIQDAALLALQHNPSFQIERLEPVIQHALETTERASFDPVFSADISLLREKDLNQTDSSTTSTDVRTHGSTRSGSFGLEQTLPTGTTLAVTASRSLDRTRGAPQRTQDYTNESHTNSVDVTLTQSLLEGFGPRVNLARLRQARLDTRISRFVLKAAAEALVYETETTGWDYLLAQQQIAIYEKSMTIAEEQLNEVRERIRVGSLADIEMAAVKAEVAKRREELINARSALAKSKIELLRLMGQRGPERWNQSVTLSNKPEVPTDTLAPLEQHVALALKQRPDLHEARLRIDRGELDVVRTRNGLLPKLDFFITLGGSRYAGSFGSTGKDEDKHSRDLEAGLSLEYALGNRSDRAAHTRNLLSLRQTVEALRNQVDLAQVDVRTAYLEVQRTAEQIEATRATRKHREEAVRSEKEKFRVGKSTSLLVAQTWRDLVASRIAEIEAVVGHLKARLNLYRQEGSLLERRGISLDGR